MKHFIYITLICISSLSVAQEVHFPKNNNENSIISKSLPINKDGTLELTNKYGSIIISTWEKDSIDVQIKLNIYDTNGNKLDKLKQNLSCKFEGNSTYQRISTNYANTSFTKELIEATNIQLLPNSHNIEYIVYVPKNINLNINNKYGNIIIPSINGNVGISLSNGDLIADKLNGSSSLHLSFGNATINYANKLNISLNHYDATISKSNSISLNSNSSNLEVNNVQHISGNAIRGRLNIGKVYYAQINSQYASLSISNLASEAHVDIKYGVLNITDVSANTKLISANSKYSGINLNLNKASGYNFNIDCETGNLSYPPEIKWSENNHSSGSFGNKNNAANIFITSVKSNVKIDLQTH